MTKAANFRRSGISLYPPERKNRTFSLNILNKSIAFIRVIWYNIHKYFLDFADEMNKSGVYIVSYWTPYRYGFYSIHTIAVKCIDGEYEPQNLKNPANFSPSNLGNRYIRGYYLGK